jgi:prepilin-type N-terminal cleavage/methylation domain-containing protein
VTTSPTLQAKLPPSAARGFTLVEMAIVLAIVGVLVTSMMFTLSAQIEQRSFNDTQSRLESAREAVLAYAIANGRLPCPATSASAGAEVRLGTGVCGATTGTAFDYYGGVSGGVTGGLLPAVTLGYQPIDSSGFALDGWGNRIRYAVSRVNTGSFPANFTNKTNMQTNGLTVLPNDLIVCASATGIVPAGSPPNCGASASNAVTNQTTVVALLYSLGKNGTTAVTLGTDEAANENRSAANDAVFIYHTPAPTTAANGEFDDQMLWITVGALYSKLLAAGVLP